MSLRLLLATLQITSAAAAYCYSRNGTALLNAAFQPCNNATPESACCMTNHSGAGDDGIADDKCLDNGLCQNFAAYDSSKNNEGEAVWSRQGCTDPLWQSPYCLADVCNGKKYEDKWGNVGVWNCGGRNWCCGQKTCCKDETNIFEIAATVGPTSTVSSATPSSSASMLSTSILSTSTPAMTLSSASEVPTSTPATSENNTSGGLSTGAKAGIGAGVAVIAILAAVVALLLFRSRKSKGRKESPSDGNMPYMDIQQEYKRQEYTQTHELDSGYAPVEFSQRGHAELAANKAPGELEARGGYLH